MQITNNYQPNFKGVTFETEKVKNILYSKLPQKEVDSFLNRLGKSPIKTTLGLADGYGFDRLDATVQYNDPKTKRGAFEYIEEKKFKNFFGLKPKSFMYKVLMNVEKIEETFQIGRYAK